MISLTAGSPCEWTWSEVDVDWDTTALFSLSTFFLSGFCFYTLGTVCVGVCVCRCIIKIYCMELAHYHEDWTDSLMQRIKIPNCAVTLVPVFSLCLSISLTRFMPRSASRLDFPVSLRLLFSVSVSDPTPRRPASERSESGSF